MNISKYLHQKVTWEQRDPGKFDDYAQPIFKAGVEIPAAVQSHTKIFRDAKGEYEYIISSVFLDTKVEQGDKINGRLVKEVTTFTNVFGEPEGYEAILE